MKRILCFVMIILITNISACCPSSEIVLSHESPDNADPTHINQLIQDPDLLEAYLLMRNHQERVQLWDGRLYSGLDLTEFLIEERIPILWDMDNHCRSEACSIMYRKNDLCTYEDGKPGIEPIYISYTSTNLGKNHLQYLVDTMAHEIFHRMQPFGKIQITQFEEFCAIYLAAKISGLSNKTVTGNYNPLNPKSLRQWMSDVGAYEYYKFEPYPESIKSLIDPLGL